VEVRPRHSAAHPGQTDQVTLADRQSFFNAKIGEMKVHRVETGPMIQNDALAAEKEFISQHYPGVIRGGDLGAKRRLEIHPAVRSSGQSVDYPAETEG
jgi:hypothetical protein